MEKIKLGLYELFSYLLPGTIMLFSAVVVLKPVDGGVVNYFKIINSISAGQALFGLLIAFLMGFSNQHISFRYFKIATKYLTCYKVDGKTIKLCQYENKLCQIRHESPANYQMIEKWMAFRGMCYNISMSLVYLFFVIIIYSSATKTFTTWNNIIILIFIVIFMFLFLRRGVSFHKWSVSSIESSYDYLDKIKK